MPDSTDLPRMPGTPPRRSPLGARLASRQSALGRGLDVLMGPTRSSLPSADEYSEPGESGPPPLGGANRRALLSRLQGVHQADLSRGFRALLTAGLSGPDEEAEASGAEPAPPQATEAPSTPVTGSPWVAAMRRSAAETPAPSPGAVATDYQVRLISLVAIRANPFQPRAQIQPEAIQRLARSIRELGILQPLVVTPAPEASGGGYIVISGERRRQAAHLAGLVEVPAIVRTLAPGAALQLALTEDLHSLPLPPLDRARLYVRLTRELRLPIPEVASRLGLPAAEIEVKLRLLTFEHEILQTIETGELTEAQADQLTQIEDEDLRRRLWRQSVRHGWSPDRMAAAIARWAAAR